MSNRLLDFADYIGSPDTQVIELFPRSQKAFQYNFNNANVAAYQFSADYQTIVVDTVTYDRVTGDPNFTDSTVVGYFANVGLVSNSYINTATASTGTVTLTIPENRYLGNITPNARANVVITVLSFQWNTSNTTTAQKDSHRWAIIERWEPGVKVGNPREETVYNGGFISLV
jgi:hypothetical protein